MTPAELEALELLVKAGKVDPTIPWVHAIKHAGDYIIQLGRQIEEDRAQKQEGE